MTITGTKQIGKHGEPIFRGTVDDIGIVNFPILMEFDAPDGKYMILYIGKRAVGFVYTVINNILTLELPKTNEQFLFIQQIIKDVLNNSK